MNHNTKLRTMTLQQPTYYDATPIFCEQFAAFLKIRTYISLKKEGDERKEVVGQILQVDLASAVLVSIFKPFGDILLKKERPITGGPGRCHHHEIICENWLTGHLKSAMDICIHQIIVLRHAQDGASVEADCIRPI
jgi:hypothetical protein